MTDTKSFEAVWLEYRPRVVSYIRRRVSAPEDAEDLCGEVFRKAWEHLRTDGAAGLSSYLYRITRNTVIDYYRTLHVHAPLTEASHLAPDPAEAVLDSAALEQLAAALRALSREERDIIVLHYYADKTLHEIACKMSLPYSVTKRRHRAALSKLRALMEDGG